MKRRSLFSHILLYILLSSCLLGTASANPPPLSHSHTTPAESPTQAESISIFTQITQSLSAALTWVWEQLVFLNNRIDEFIIKTFYSPKKK